MGKKNKMTEEEANFLMNGGSSIPLPPSQNGGREAILPEMLGGDRMGREFTEYEWNALREIFNPGKKHELDARTDLTTDQIAIFASARRIASHYGIEGLDDLVDDLERLSISKDRKSRKELVKAFGAQDRNDERTAGIFSRLGQ